MGLHKTTKKDPNAPKRPLSAYNFYLKSTWKTVGGPFSLRGKRVAANWKAASASTREPYYVLQREDKVRYDSEMAEYCKDLEGTLIPRGRKFKQVKKARPVSAYNVFVHVQHTLRAVTTEALAQEWSTYNDEQKKEWSVQHKRRVMALESELEESLEPLGPETMELEPLDDDSLFELMKDISFV
tara:strand:+ start:1181 stop:1732 length:552 start_codon:yes stop_codon:yes gene_type:complete